MTVIVAGVRTTRGGFWTAVQYSFSAKGRRDYHNKVMKLSEVGPTSNSQQVPCYSHYSLPVPAYAFDREVYHLAASLAHASFHGHS